MERFAVHPKVRLPFPKRSRYLSPKGQATVQCLCRGTDFRGNLHRNSVLHGDEESKLTLSGDTQRIRADGQWRVHRRRM